jgi:hypothetical protein
MSYKTVNGPLGVDVAKTYSVPEFDLGQKVECVDSANGDQAIFRFVRSASALTEFLVYIIPSSWTIADSLTTTTDNKAPVALGVVQDTWSAVATGYTYRYGWIQTAGNFPYIEMLQSCAPDVELYSTSSPGKVDDATGGKLISGLKGVHTALSLDSAAGEAEAFAANEIYLPSDA